MVKAAVAVAQLEGAAPKGQPQDLVTQTDAEQRQAGLGNQPPGQLNASGDGGRIARAIGKEHPFRLVLEHLLERGVGGQDGDHTAMGHQALEDGPFDAEIDRHHAVGAIGTLLQPGIKGSTTGAIPLIRLWG